MQPVHKLLNQIRWDPRFRKGRFALGYFDHMARRILVVPFDNILIWERRPPGDRSG